MKPNEKLLIQNKAWAQEKRRLDPHYFERLTGVQTPKFLWIGCSDSRVPANEITGTEPGEIFVHRNIANIVIHTDLNLLSVLLYAIEVLKVEHVIVCGHYGCGGVRAALAQKDFGLLNKWLTHIKDVAHQHREEIAALHDPQIREDKLVEWSVRQQLRNLSKTAIVQQAWAKHRRPWLHGWVYRLGDGILHELESVEPGSTVEPAYRYDFDAI